MRRRAWLLLLIAGLAVSACPVGSRLKRGWLMWNAAVIWNCCCNEPALGLHGEPSLWLEIPAANISQLVLTGVDRENLSRFPGSESIGLATLIMAHRDTHFRELNAIKEGDEVLIETRDGSVAVYRVRRIHICAKQEVESFLQEQSKHECVLLLTCYPFRFIGPAPDRFVAVAEPV
ncbi:MAG: class D sortase [Pontiellaceae bacterium]|nr:class D sortase [Pontiellaceae bacterium]MBN2784652.1 class D sortase [Pontiellaceae bacterium]